MINLLFLEGTIMKRIFLSIVSLFFVGSAVAEDIDPRASLAVTETEILRLFTLERVLDQIGPEQGALTLFRQLWDTQNRAPGLGLGDHCNDTEDARGRPILNGFPYACRASEGLQARQNPFSRFQSALTGYLPVGIFNRFDLAAKNGAHCGEYRIAFARRSGILNPVQRAFMIFEAALPNPNPDQGLEGCRPIVDFWASLTGLSLSERRDKLEAFYFTGVDNLPPVVSPAHYGQNGQGQVRVNMFMNIPVITGQWMLKEFTFVDGRFKMVVGNDNIPGTLFADNSPDSRAPAFQDAFINQLPDLLVDSVPRISAQFDPRFYSGQSISSLSNETNYSAHFRAGLFKDRVQARLTELGSTITPEQAVERAQAMVCAGCHQLSNNQDLGEGLRWPASLQFTHTSERTEVVDGVRRHRLSAAVREVFLPDREKIMEDFLNHTLVLPNIQPMEPLSGDKPH